MKISVFFENSLQFLQKTNLPHNTTPVWNQNFLTHHNRFFTKTFLPYFGRQGEFSDIAKSADFQTNKNFSDNDSMTVEFYKNFYQRNDVRLRILGNKY